MREGAELATVAGASASRGREDAAACAVGEVAGRAGADRVGAEVGERVGRSAAAVGRADAGLRGVVAVVAGAGAGAGTAADGRCVGRALEARARSVAVKSRGTEGSATHGRAGLVSRAELKYIDAGANLDEAEDGSTNADSRAGAAWEDEGGQRLISVNQRRLDILPPPSTLAKALRLTSEPCDTVECQRLRRRETRKRSQRTPWRRLASRPGMETI